FFFFQAEDAIRDFHVTGVQTCALPICQQQYEGPGEIEHQPATAAATIFSSLPANPANAAEFDWSLAPGVAPRTGGLVIFTGNLAARAGGAIGGTTFRGAADPNGPKWWQGWTTYTDN